MWIIPLFSIWINLSQLTGEELKVISFFILHRTMPACLSAEFDPVLYCWLVSFKINSHLGYPKNWGSTVQFQKSNRELIAKKVYVLLYLYILRPFSLSPVKMEEWTNQFMKLCRVNVNMFIKTDILQLLVCFIDESRTKPWFKAPL